MLALLLALGALGAQAPAGELVVRDVTVVDTAAGRLVPHRTVLVRGDRIVAVEEAGGALPDGARVIAGAGRFLVPGLVDAHVHVSERDLPLFLANGVTGVRELNGSPTHLALRARVAAGALLGPRLAVASPLLAGERQRWRHVLLTDPDAAMDEAERCAEAGYDALKIYDGLAPEVYEVLAAVAHERGLALVGHVPERVGLDGVLAAGQDLEHNEQILRATLGHALDRAALPGIAARIAAAKVTVTPTLAAQEILCQAGDAAYAARLERPEMAYVERDTLGWWQSLRGSGEGGDGPGEYYLVQAALVKALADAGVPLLVGTDTPNPLLVPGFALHDELAALVGAGLTPQAVLRAATVGAAEHLGWSDQGRIAPGLRADLVLVEADPFAELGTLRRPLAVCAAGRWLERAELARLIAPLARGD